MDAMIRRIILSATSFFLFINCVAIWAQVASEVKPTTTNEAQIAFSKADRYFATGRFHDAAQEYQRGLSLNPDVFSAQTRLGLSLIRLRQPQEAINAFKMALKLRPGNDRAYTNLSYGYLEAGQFAEALEAAREAVRLNSKSSLAYNNLGYAYLRLGQYDESINALKQSIDLDPAYVKAYSNLGQAYFRLGRHGEAAEVLEKSVRLNPNDWEPHLVLGQVDFCLERYEQAADQLGQALRIDPTKINAYFQRGEALGRLRRFEEAVEAFTQGIKLRPQEAEAYRSRAYANLNLGRGDEAAADAETYLKISGGQNRSRLYTMLVIYLGKLQSGRRAEASGVIEEAMIAGDSLAWPIPVIRYLRGEISAEGLLAEANDGDKKTEAYAYIGLQLSISGRREEAIPYLQWVKENGNRKFVEYPLALSELEHRE
jgi:tetratricopeptide (TPR) repeat protein